MNKRGLGKGLGALLPDAMEARGGAPQEIATDLIDANPYQPRVAFDPEKLAELVESVRQHGVLQPVLLRRMPEGRYQLIAGERRVRAAREAGLRTVPALVRECPERDMLEVALIENLQREDINPVEAAHAYTRLATDFGMTQEEIARRVGRSRPAVANTVRLLALPEPVLESLAAGEISEAHARAILQAAPARRLSVWQTIRSRKLSVRAAERLGRELSAGAERGEAVVRSRPARTDPNLAAVEEALRTALGTKVTVRQTGETGRIEIEFYSADQLEGIVERILGAG